jgi:hypothetical protein
MKNRLRRYDLQWSDFWIKPVRCCRVLLILLVILFSVQPSSAEENGQQIPVVEKNLARWKKMGESGREYYRKLYEQYISLSAEEQTLLKKKQKQFNKLDRKVREIILRNSKMLASLSREDRRSFYRLIKKYRNLSPSKKAQVHRAFKKIRGLSKEKRQELFSLLLEENRKDKPKIKKVIRDFLKQAELHDHEDGHSGG